MILVNSGRKELRDLIRNTVLHSDSPLVDLGKWLDFNGDVYLGEMSSERPQKTAEGKQNNHQHPHTAIALSKYSDYLRETGGTEDSQFVDWLARQQQ